MTTTVYAVDRIHARIVALLEAQTPELDVEQRVGHVGSTDYLYSVSNSACRGILKTVAPDINRLAIPEQTELLTLLARGTSHEEKTMVGMLLQMRGSLRAHLRPAALRGWLGEFHGWAQIDALCQNVFTAEDILTDWNGWQSLFGALTESEDPRERRASLVLLVGPVRWNRDERLLSQAHVSLRNAIDSRDRLVTRAVSRLLREMLRMYRAEVERFVSVNEAELDRSVLRELTMKLQTGGE